MTIHRHDGQSGLTKLERVSKLSTKDNDVILTGTPLQIAYATYDVEMCALLIKYFNELADGKEQAFSLEKP